MKVLIEFLFTESYCEASFVFLKAICVCRLLSWTVCIEFLIYLPFFFCNSPTIYHALRKKAMRSPWSERRKWRKRLKEWESFRRRQHFKFIKRAIVSFKAKWTFHCCSFKTRKMGLSEVEGILLKKFALTKFVEISKEHFSYQDASTESSMSQHGATSNDYMEWFWLKEWKKVHWCRDIEVLEL